MKQNLQKHVFFTEMMRILINCQVKKWEFDGGIDPRLKIFNQEKIGDDEDTVSKYLDLFDEDLNCPHVRKKHQHDDDSYPGIQKGLSNPLDQQEKKERNNRSGKSIFSNA